MAFLQVLALVCSSVVFAATLSFATEAQCNPMGTYSNPARSCRHLRENRGAEVGAFADGIFFINPDRSNGVPFPVFCDMTTDGGGWTLVAVVANGDYQHWTYDDRHSDAGQRTSNWEAQTTIGELTYRTPFDNKDFKSKAFYAVEGKEILLTYKGEGLARTTNTCLGGQTLRALLNAYRFSCSDNGYRCYYGNNKCLAAGGRSPSSSCSHECVLSQQYMSDMESDNQGIAAAGETSLYVKTGEANGAQDTNKDRSYFSFPKARTTVHYPRGLGSFSRISGTVASNDIGIHNDASTRPTDKSRFYGIYVR